MLDVDFHIHYMHDCSAVVNVFTVMWPAVSDVFLAGPYNPCSFISKLILYAVMIAKAA